LKYVNENKIGFQAIDTVYLKNGRQLKGIIRKETKDSVTLEVNIDNNMVGTVKLSRDNIERIATGKNN